MILLSTHHVITIDLCQPARCRKEHFHRNLIQLCSILNETSFYLTMISSSNEFCSVMMPKCQDINHFSDEQLHLFVIVPKQVAMWPNCPVAKLPCGQVAMWPSCHVAKLPCGQVAIAWCQLGSGSGIRPTLFTANLINIFNYWNCRIIPSEATV